LGKGDAGDLFEGLVILQNVGSEPLSFTNAVSCGCAYVRPLAGEIQPGETREVQTGIRLRREGQKEEVLLTIHSSDPKHSVTEHVFTASSRAYFLARPGMLTFGPIREGTTREIRLVIRDGDDQPLSSDRNCTIAVSNDNIVVQRETTPTGEYGLVVSNLSSARRGPLRALLELRFPPDNQHVVTVPIEAEVVGSLRHAPAQVELDGRPDDRRPSHLIVWRTDEQPLGCVSVIEAPQAIQVSEVGASDNGKRRILRFSPTDGYDASVAASGPSDHVAMVSLKFDGVEEILRIPVRLPN
jgi:hypothetical protein